MSRSSRIACSSPNLPCCTAVHMSTLGWKVSERFGLEVVWVFLFRMLRGDCAEALEESLAGAMSDERDSRDSVDVSDVSEENEESEQIDVRSPNPVMGSKSPVDLHMMQEPVVGDAQGLTESSTGPMLFLKKKKSFVTNFRKGLGVVYSKYLATQIRTV
eukprot:scpid89198/ scgid12506/ 